MFETIAFIILFIIAFGILFKVIKSVMKVILIALLIILFVGGALGFLLYEDVKDFRANFGKEPNLMLLKSGNDILTGYEAKGFDTGGKMPQALAPDMLVNVEQLYKSSQLKKISGDYYRIMLFDIDLFSKELPDAVEIQFSQNSTDNAGQNISKSAMIGILNSSQPLEAYLDVALENDEQGNNTEEQSRNMARENILEQFNTTDNFRAAMFKASLDQVTEKKSLMLLYKRYNKDDFIIYPKTIMFVAVQRLPDIILRFF